MSDRYAVYFVPAKDSALDRFGAGWFGRTSQREQERRLSVPGISDSERDDLTRVPRIYGLHATLRPPFVLVETADSNDVERRVSSIARQTGAFEVPALVTGSTGGCLTLSLSHACAEVEQLAAYCLRELDELRRPQEGSDCERYRAYSLSEREQHLFARWGYPWVLDRFVFHFTLTSRINREKRERIARALAPQLDCIVGIPWLFDSISVLRQSEHGGVFVEISRHQLGGAV